MNEEKSIRILKISRGLILLLLGVTGLSFFSLNEGNNINPVTIIGSLLCVMMIAYLLGFFVWGQILLQQLNSNDIFKPDCYKKSLLILILGVILPYAFVLLWIWLGLTGQ